METRAHHALIGVFTLGVLVLCFAFIWWFAGRADLGKRQAYRIQFEGSVSGLTQGSAVLFNGIKVGEVLRLQLDSADPRRVIAYVAIDTNTTVRSDTKARLESQGFTGVAVVGLLGGLPDAAPVAPAADDGPPMLIAEPSAAQDLMEGARNILARADGIMKTVEAVVADNRENVTQTIGNVRTFTDALAKNSDKVSAFLENVGTAAQQVGTLSKRLEGFVDEVQKVVAAIEPDAIRETVNNTRQFTATLNRFGPKLDELITNASGLSTTLRQAGGRIDGILASVGRVVDRVDADKVGKSIDNFSAFSDTLNKNRDPLDQIVANARELSQRVNEASKRLDSILMKTDAFLGNANDKGLMEEIKLAARSIQDLSNNMDRRVGEISVGLNRFSNQGLRELELLISSSRSTITDVDRVVRDFKRNPSGFLFGKNGIPEYSRSR